MRVLYMKQYEVEFYEDEQRFCPITDWIRELDQIHSKDNRSMLKKVYFQIERLGNEGPNVGEPIAKRLDEDIWELRPIPNRIFVGIMKGKGIVLLHHFRKRVRRLPDMKSKKRNENMPVGSSEVKRYEMG
jgi:phage-related protein